MVTMVIAIRYSTGFADCVVRLRLRLRPIVYLLLMMTVKRISEVCCCVVVVVGITFLLFSFRWINGKERKRLDSTRHDDSTRLTHSLTDGVGSAVQY